MEIYFTLAFNHDNSWIYFNFFFQALGIRIQAFLDGLTSSEIYLSRDFQSDENFIDDGKAFLYIKHSVSINTF